MEDGLDGVLFFWPFADFFLVVPSRDLLVLDADNDASMLSREDLRL